MTREEERLLAELSEVTKKIVQLRESMGGRLPKDIWLKVVELNGYYFGIELLLINGQGKAVLKIRHDADSNEKEKVWEGKLHLPGMVVAPGTPAEKLFLILIEKEIVEGGNHELAEKLASQVEFFKLVKYEAAERNTQPYSLIMKLNIGDLDEKFQKDLKVVEGSDLKNVLDLHKPILQEYYSWI